MGVEKLLLTKFAKIKSCQDAPRTTFPVFPDIFYPPNFGCFEKNGLFPTPTPDYVNYDSRQFFKLIGCTAMDWATISVPGQEWRGA